MRELRYWKTIPMFDWLPGSTYNLIPVLTVLEKDAGTKLFDLIVAAVKESGDLGYSIIDMKEVLLDFRSSKGDK